MIATSAARSSLSVDGPMSSKAALAPVSNYSGLDRPPHLSRLESQFAKTVKVEPLDILVNSEGDFVAGFLHLPPDFTAPAQSNHHQTAAILVSGAGGGVTGPSAMYLSLAHKLAMIGSGIPALRLDYRHPARLSYCVEDIKAAMNLLRDLYGLNRFVLVGWSFGGAPVLTVGGGDERAIACATISSQVADTDGIQALSPRPVLFIHGTNDKTLSSACSDDLFDHYGDNGNRKLNLFEGDDHTLRQNVIEAEWMLLGFITNAAGIMVDEKEKAAIAQEPLLDILERFDLMERGGDLRPPEQVE